MQSLQNFIKSLNDNNRQALLARYNDVLLDGKYPDSLNRASLASIWRKKGSSKTGQFSSIALLQAFYNILTALVENRIEPAPEPWMSKAQYGFGKKKSMAGIFIARRYMNMTERQGTNISLILFDWGKRHSTK